MLNPDSLSRIRRIDIIARHLVHNAFVGAYQSVFKGQGMIFESVRPYEPGDDVRNIDWKVTARTGQPFIKRYTEERELTMMLVIDVSASTMFGTTDRQKRDVAAQLGAILAYLAILNNDKAGLISFTDKIERYVPPKKGRKHILRMIHEMITLQPTGKETNLSLALRTLNRTTKPGSILFLISDFMLPSKAYYRDLLMTSQLHDVISIVLSDPLEAMFPAVGMVVLQDSENDAIQWVDTDSLEWQRSFQERIQRFHSQRDKALSRAKVDRIDIPPDGDFIHAMSMFFKEREQRRFR